MLITLSCHNIIRSFQLIAETIPADLFRKDWILVIIMVPLILYLFIAVIEKQVFTVLTRTVLSNRYASAQFRSKGAGRKISGIMLGIISLVNIATFSYFTEITFNVFFFGLSGFFLWLFNLGVISLSILFRYFVSVTTGGVTNSRETFNEYYYNISRFYMFLSVILLFINFLIPYLVIIPDIYLIGFTVVLAAILLILRIIRLANIFLKRSFSLLNMILYLCTLEFIPMLISIKFLSGAL